MTDLRTRLSNHRVAHESVTGIEGSVKVTDGVLKSVSKPVVDLLHEPDGSIGRQLLFGESFLELDVDPATGYAFGQALDGAYVGYVVSDTLETAVLPTHRVCTMGAHIYSAADIKSPVLTQLPFMAIVGKYQDAGEFIQIHNGGYMHKQQLAPAGQVEPDFVATALRLLDVPYLWGGDSNFGLDCSGLIHTSLRAAGRDCPRDSDQQQQLGSHIASGEQLRRGDLVFWDGHVGLMCDNKTMVHANGHYMAVACEDFAQACVRIAASGYGPVTCRRRI